MMITLSLKNKCQPKIKLLEQNPNSTKLTKELTPQQCKCLIVQPQSLFTTLHIQI